MDKLPARCPDGSWSKWRVVHCKLPMGHKGPHDYEVRVITPEAQPIFSEAR